MELPAAVRALWERYLAAEAACLRRDALAALREFIAGMEALETPAQRAWAREYLQRALPSNQDPPLRVPLFERLLFPALKEDYDAGDARAAKWLAEHSQYLFRCKACWEAMGHPAETDLWKEAYRRNPTDERARRLLVERTAAFIRYTLHELPAGVLYGFNGATERECKLLQQELESFRGLLRGREIDDFGDLVRDAEYHYRAYREYLQQRTSYRSYAEFLGTVR